MLSPLDLSERLDLNIKTVKLLVKDGFLPPYTIRPWGPKYFEPETVERFEQEFLSEEKYILVDRKPDGYFSTFEAVKKIANTRLDIDTSKLLHLVREGVFNPILCKEGKGLSRLLFHEKEIRNYRDTDTEQKRDNNKLSLFRTGGILGIDMRLILYLIDAGLVTATIEDIDGKQKTYIMRQDLDKFLEEYLFIGEAAALMNFNTDTVVRWIKQGRLNDYSGIPSSKRTHIRILRREEVKPLMPGNIMDVPEAAEYLNLPPWEVYDLIDKNILSTLKGKGPGKTPFHRIPRQEIVHYKENLLKPARENYMGVGQAAKYLGVGRSTIYRLRNKKILATTSHKEKQTTLIPLQELVNYKKTCSREI